MLQILGANPDISIMLGTTMVGNRIGIIIPALNEEESIGRVISEIPKNLVSEIVVVDNGSTDRTGIVAGNCGARVIDEPTRGYGRACAAGIKYFEENPPSIIVFLDGDYSDFPGEVSHLVQPIAQNRADLVLGSRLAKWQRGNYVPIHVVLANKLFVGLVNLLCGLNLTDLGPFRAIRWNALTQLYMTSQTFGWSSEMIVKAAMNRFRITEIAVSYRKRLGTSKISGSIRGSMTAALQMLFTILRYRMF